MILFVFVDGVGVGAFDAGVNPLARGRYLLSQFEGGRGEPLPRHGRLGLADACLGVPGRPQSATGHTTILTGENAPRLLGRHLLGFPNEPLRARLRAANLFLALRAAGRSAAYANAYHAGYLDALGLPHAPSGVPEPPLPVKASRLRPSASTVAASAAALELRTFGALVRGEAVFHDITGAMLRERGVDVPLRTPEESAAVLLDLARRHDLCFFEYFRTDEAGHARDFDAAERALDDLDRLLRAAVAGLRDGEGLFVCSDHGNLEDLGSRQHTLNPVPVLGFGSAARVVDEVRSLTDVHPALLRLAGVA